MLFGTLLSFGSLRWRNETSWGSEQNTIFKRRLSPRFTEVVKVTEMVYIGSKWLTLLEPVQVSVGEQKYSYLSLVEMLFHKSWEVLLPPALKPSRSGVVQATLWPKTANGKCILYIALVVAWQILRSICRAVCRKSSRPVKRNRTCNCSTIILQGYS